MTGAPDRHRILRAWDVEAGPRTSSLTVSLGRTAPARGPQESHDKDMTMDVSPLFRPFRLGSLDLPRG
jgi:hypothetical protein